MHSVSYNFLHSYNSERDVGKSVRVPMVLTAALGGTAMMLYHELGALG